MSTQAQDLEALANQEYQYGFVSAIETDTIPRGLNEEIVRMISAKKLEWRLKAYRQWLKMAEPQSIDYKNIISCSALKTNADGPKSLEEVDPELLAIYEKLGVPLQERGILAGVAVDAIFDSVSVAAAFCAKLAEDGVIFCSFSEAVHNHPELVEKYLGSVVPYTDNFFATLRAAFLTTMEP